MSWNICIEDGKPCMYYTMMEECGGMIIQDKQIFKVYEILYGGEPKFDGEFKSLNQAMDRVESFT